MRFMLDTNACIVLIRRRPERIVQHFTRHTAGEIGISSITLAELHYGVAKSEQRERNAAALAEFILPLEIAPFDDRAAMAYGAVRAALERRGTPIGALDGLIGAHALSLGATLVTNNIKEFKRIPRLKLADWTA